MNLNECKNKMIIYNVPQSLSHKARRQTADGEVYSYILLGKAWVQHKTRNFRLDDNLFC